MEELSIRLHLKLFDGIRIQQSHLSLSVEITLCADGCHQRHQTIVIHRKSILKQGTQFRVAIRDMLRSLYKTEYGGANLALITIGLVNFQSTRGLKD